jgi:S-DNA-T family DNA segregation ATPase FtsK/SpoIIIE
VEAVGHIDLLRGIVQELVARHRPGELVFAVMDLRGEVAAVVPPDYLGAHARTAVQARNLAEAVAQDLAGRSSGDDSPHPRVVVLADDYDMVASAGTGPLRPVMP